MVTFSVLLICIERMNDYMKNNLKKTLSILAAILLILGIFAGCSKNGTSDVEKDAEVDGKFVGSDKDDDEPLSEADDKWVESDDFIGEGSEQSFTDKEIKGYIASALGSDFKFSGDYASLTDEQREKIEDAFYLDGYTVKVTDSGITYLSYTSKLKADELKDIINQTLSDEDNPYIWSGNFMDLNDEEKREVSQALQDKGFNVVITDKGPYYSSDHEDDVIVDDEISHIQGTPSKPVVQAALIQIDEAFKNWDGDYSKLKLTDEQRQQLINSLKEVGYNVFFLEDGPIYLGGWIDGGKDEPTNKKVPVTGVTLASDKAYVALNSTCQLTATVSPKKATNPSVSWSSDNTEIAKVSSTGIVRGYKVGSAVITVTTEDGNFTAKCTVNVLADEVKVKSISVSPKSASVSIGNSLQLTTEIKPENATNTAVTWKSSDTSIATVSQTGLVVAKAKGEATVTVTTADGSISAESKIKVTSTIDGTTKKFALTFGGTNYDKFDSVTATSDGGYVALGNYLSNNEDYALENKGNSQKTSLVKFNSKGEKEWIQVIGGNDGVTFYDIAELTDGSLVAVGTTMSSKTYPECTGNSSVKSGTVDALIIRYSSKGELEWFKSVKGSKGEYFSSVSATPDGGFVVGGKVESSDGDFEGLSGDIIKAVIIKYNKDCEPQWKRALNGSRHNNITSIDVNASGFIYATCVSASNDGDFEKLGGKGGYDTIILKLSKNGEMKWYKSLSGNGVDEYSAIACTGDGGCITVGWFNSSNHFYSDTTVKGGYDAGAVKLDADGNVDWFKSYGGSESDYFTGVVAVNGGYAVIGYTESDDSSFSSLGNKGDADSFILMLNPNGTKFNMTAINGTGFDKAQAIYASEDRTSFAVVGHTESNDHYFKGLKAPGKDKHISFILGYDVVK